MPLRLECHKGGKTSDYRVKNRALIHPFLVSNKAVLTLSVMTI